MPFTLRRTNDLSLPKTLSGRRLAHIDGLGAYITGTVDQELLFRNEYLATENRIPKDQLKGWLLVSDAARTSLAEIASGQKTPTY